MTTKISALQYACILKNYTRVLALVSLVCFTSGGALAGHLNKARVTKADTTISAEIKTQLKEYKRQEVLYFQHSVFKFYRRNNFQPVWVNPGVDSKRTWEGVLLLNCVLQFGLYHADYHPKEIDYDRLHIILEHPEQVNNNEKARYEIMITDALITFMNHLHYGKLNPYFTVTKIDAGKANDFSAYSLLADALKQSHIMSTILSAQPKSKEYAVLQEKMREITQYQQDCDDVPQANIRKIAINLERLRWANIDENAWIQLNIPSYLLKVHLPDTTFIFRAVVGNTIAPTPILNSAITDFTTASRLKFPKVADEMAVNWNPKGVIYFWFKNHHAISLEGRPEKDIFSKQERAYSRDGIKVEQPEKLAELLLKQDGNAAAISSLYESIANYSITNFVLKKPVPIKITYLTCEVQNNVLTVYKDIYELDNSLEMALYNTRQLMVAN
jgi:murein L,D-transpeptidase YcbB/YkuD